MILLLMGMKSYKLLLLIVIGNDYLCNTIYELVKAKNKLLSLFFDKIKASVIKMN